MKRWAPIAYPGPGDTHRNADPGAGIRGSWPDGEGYQQILDELANLVEKAGLTLDGTSSLQLALAARSQRLNWRTIGGSANALTMTLDPAPAAYADLLGVPLRGIATATSTGAATLNVNSLGTKAIVRRSGNGTAALAEGDIRAGTVMELFYNGTAFQLINPAGRDPANSGVGYQGYATAGTYSWTVPDGVYFIDIELCGAGGGGAGANGTLVTSGGGGGAGGAAFSVLPVTPGDVINITVGAGGAFGPAANSSTASATQGGNGGSTTASNGAKWTITCAGGSAGVSTAPGVGGSPSGSGFGGYGNSGGYGTPGFALVSGAGSPPYAFGGAGGVSFFGGSGASLYLTAASGGRAPGSGGGGGMIYPGTGIHNGGAGAPGIVNIRF